MKKAILNMLMLFAVTGVATAQTVTVADVEALPGETVKATLELSVPADTYTGVQLALQFPTTGFSNVAIGDGTSFGNIQAGAMTDGKVKIAAAEATTFESKTIVVDFDVDGSLALGEYPVTVTGQFEGTGVADAPINVTFKVIVTDRITLDENSTALPIARSNVNVKVKRTIYANEWSTICLPFELAAADAKTVFGNDVQIMRFSSYEAEIDNTSNKINAINLNFTKHTKKLQVGTPYMIRTTKDIHNFNMDNVNISETVSYTNVEIENDNLDYTGTFKGTFYKTKVPNNGLFISGNKFYYSAGKTNIMAFRGWFELEAILDETVSANANINITFDDEATGINTVHGANGNAEGTYDLQGRKVEEPTNKGLYIVNGHKVVIK